jgi:hypothetical protein
MPMRQGSQLIYVDESGSPDVVVRGGKDLLANGLTSNYLVIAAIRCENPSALASAVQRCVDWADSRYGTGIGLDPVTAIHARDDRNDVRQQVYRELCSLDVKAMSIVMDKRLLDPAKPWRTDRKRFYNEMVAYLLADVLHQYQTTHIIFSHKNFETTADLQDLVNALAQRWRTVMQRSGLPVPASVTATERRHAQNKGLQAADYIAWAVFRAFERSDLAPLVALQPILRHVWDLGRLTHYSRKNPITAAP